MSAERRIKHVGHGPSGTPAYVVLDQHGEYVKTGDGQFLFTSAQAVLVAQNTPGEQ